MDEYQEMERFGMDNDYEDGQWIGGEFYGKRRQKRSKKRRKDLSKKIDYRKPVNFISTGSVMPSHEIERTSKEDSEVIDEDDLKPAGLGLGASAGLGFGSASSKNATREEKDEGDEFLPTAFGKKIMEGARLRREREKEKSMQKKKSSEAGKRELDPTGVGSFEKHTKGIGMKLLEKMGYKGGGLGKNEQGIMAPIEAKLRPKNMGMGFNDYKEAVRSAIQEADEKPTPHPSQALEVRSKEKLWSKQGLKKKKVYITAEELLAQKQERGFEVVQKVFDMRGPQVRVLTNLENLNAEDKARENNVPMPELQRNIRLIVDLADLDIQKLDNDLRNERETVVALQKEKEKLQKEAHHRKQQLETMEEIQSVLDQIGKKSSSGTLTLESLAKSFVDLQTRFADDYKLCNLSCIACFLSIHAAAYGSCIPCRENIWHQLLARADPKPMLKFLESWEELLPPLVLQNILDGVVMPKISAAVDSWDPRTETIPIHSWIRPWFPLLGQKLENCYHTIRHRLASVLHAWHPSDMSAYYILSPLKTVFDPASWEQLMVRYIIPKLLTVMDELPINPANQNLDQFYWVRTWVTAIPTHHMLQLMDVFFNKWQEVLYHWLCSKPNFEEVTKWYLGWKELLPPELQANEHIRYRLNIGLDMMNQAVEGMEVAPPGLKENISYLRVREQRQFETQKKAAAQAQRVSPGLDSGIQAEGNSGGLDMSLKEVIEIHAQHNGLLFKPKPGRTQDGHQIYGFGNISIIIDSLNQKVFAQTDDRWSLVSLEQPLELHNRSRLKRH
ncbi:hypothetical protein DH2020_035957 [Rehmannia glutinosa]|uniref:G-patch domain-containing protein n=1 Tax=Rehmannia glutinosa TaxID=99300 RepID=A0ABR0V8G4_REHGL